MVYRWEERGINFIDNSADSSIVAMVVSIQTAAFSFLTVVYDDDVGIMTVVYDGGR